MFYKEYMNYDISAIYYGTDTRIFSILIGSAFYFIFKDKKLNSKKANILSYIFLGIIIFITLSVDYLSKSNYYGFLYLISILGGFITVTSLKTGFLDLVIFTKFLVECPILKEVGIYFLFYTLGVYQ